MTAAVGTPLAWVCTAWPPRTRRHRWSPGMRSSRWRRQTSSDCMNNDLLDGVAWLERRRTTSSGADELKQPEAAGTTGDGQCCLVQMN
jgi:hypothetical protein